LNIQNFLFTGSSLPVGLFFGFLPPGFLGSLLLVKVFLAQSLILLDFAISYLDGKKGFALPASERTLKNIFSNKKAAIRVAGRTLDINLHQVNAPSFFFLYLTIVLFGRQFVNQSGF
jgi:hypothetical protein